MNTKAFLPALLLGFLPLTAPPAHAASGLWSDVAASQIATRGQRFVTPERGRTLTLDYAAMQQLLKDAPLESEIAAVNSPFELELPLPEGGFGRFSVVESPIMESKLADRYPTIKTYLGQGIDDPTATLRFDLTQLGFRAQLISWKETLYIEPFQREDTLHYVVFSKDDYRPRGEPMVCSVTGEPLKNLPNFQQRGLTAKVSSGANLRTYRLAVAATGEYTVALGGTVLDGLSGIVTTMNRVNGIYEREVSVRMVLVANNDLLIYTNAGTDPYANDSNDLGANQTNITSLIGTANFDIGHLVGTGGGGVAGLGVVCNAGNKARGLTGSGNPIADAFDVDFVAHEMGHQFRGNHTFNGSGGNCSGGNRNASTAYEPGSGITIQAYAGICAADNLQPNSEDYFHRVSLNEMLAFTTNVTTGASCGALTSTGNGVPTVTAPAAVTIPRSTPFRLTATGSDPNGDALTYVWEQFDLGAANAVGSILDDGARPIFRSFDPTPSPTRIFPSLRFILNNANEAPATAPLPGTASPNWLTAEVLPTTARTMNFRVTVRDNRAGGGGTNEASVAVTTAAAGVGPFIVTAPDTAVSWAAGSSQTITWNVAGTTANGVNTATVEIALSRDGGLTFPTILAASTVNDGTETLTIPAGIPASTQARIRVAAVGNIFFDIGNANFTITGSNTAPILTVSNFVTTRQGSPAVVGNVATVSDPPDAAGSLSVALSDVPQEMTASVVNNAGTVSLTAAASCTLVAPTSGNKTYPIQLTVTDTSGASTTLPVTVLVGANQIPTLGNYSNVNMARSSSSTATPSAAIADSNSNLTTSTVSPSTLPGGGTVTIAANGTVTITTTAGTTLGTYAVTAQANDTCGAVRIRRFNVTVSSTQPALAVAQSSVLTGNNLIEPNECNQLNVSLSNTGTATASAVTATLSTSTPNVTITQATAAYADIAAGGTGTNLTPFQISSSNALVCLSNINLNLNVTYTGGGSPASLSFNLPVGQAENPNYVFVAGTGAAIPPGGTVIVGSNTDDGIFSVTTPAGMNFSVYGAPVTGGSVIRVTTNGTLQIVGSGGSRQYSNGALPSAGTGDFGEFFPASAPVLFPWWDDLQLNPTGGGIYLNTVGAAPNRQFFVEWRGRSIGDGAAALNLNFAVVFSENSDTIQYRYVQTGAGAALNGAGATSGVQAATTGTLFTQYSLNQAMIAAGTVLTAARVPGICSSGAGQCVINLAPTIIPASGLSRQQGSPPANSPIATVTDDGGNGAVMVTGAGTLNGITLSNIVNTLGNITGNLIASCTAGNAAFTLVASDGFLSSNGTLNVSAAANTPPNQGNYGNASLIAGNGTTVNPSVVPSDNGSIATITAAAAGFTGGLTVNPATGVVTVTNAGPVSVTPYTITVTATDNCGATSTVTFQLTVNGADLFIVKTSSLNLVNLGLIQYTLIANNAGPIAAPSANVTDTFPTGLTNVAWTCVGIGGASCPANGTGNINQTVNLPSGGRVEFSVTAQFSAAVVGDSLSNTATVSSTVADPNLANNSSTVVNGIWLFKNGFGPTGSSILLDLADVGITQSVALPSASMTALLISHSPAQVVRFDIGTHRVMIEARQLGPAAQARLLQRDHLGGWTIGEWANLPAINARFAWTSQAGNALSIAIRGD